MGASDSKLVFKKGIFRLSEERHIPAGDAYWSSVSFDVHLLLHAPSAPRCTPKASLSPT